MGNVFGGDAAAQYSIDFSQTAVGPDRVNDVLVSCRSMLDDLNNYKGCGEVIREALSNSSNQETQKRAYTVVTPNIARIQKYYTLSSEISEAMVLLSAHLDNRDNFVFAQEYARSLCELAVFCFDFDQKKMLKPELQNDFSFYRRSLGNSNLQSLPTPVPPQDANAISMWIANNLPMISSIKNISTAPLAMLCNICMNMAVTPSAQQSYILKCMVALVIIYDRAANLGVFVPNSPIKVKKVIKVIKQYGKEDQATLLNSIRFCTLHYNDASTPTSIKQACS